MNGLYECCRKQSKLFKRGTYVYGGDIRQEGIKQTHLPDPVDTFVLTILILLCHYNGHTHNICIQVMLTLCKKIYTTIHTRLT